jgi:hypothetical protein
LLDSFLSSGREGIARHFFILSLSVVFPHCHWREDCLVLMLVPPLGHSSSRLSFAPLGFFFAPPQFFAPGAKGGEIRIRGEVNHVQKKLDLP